MRETERRAPGETKAADRLGSGGSGGAPQNHCFLFFFLTCEKKKKNKVTANLGLRTLPPRWRAEWRPSGSSRESEFTLQAEGKKTTFIHF